MAISSVYQVTGSDADLVQTYSDLLDTYTLDLTSQYTDAQATINTSLTSAQVYATAALASENAAATSAAAGAISASTATTQAASATTSASTATTKASEASTSAANAASSAATATTKASEASTSATNSAASAVASANSATNSATSATASANSATAAAASEAAASVSEANAGTSETNVSTSETNAASSASSASTSATTATTQAGIATDQAVIATTQATNSSNSATSSANSATASANSATSASNAQTAAESARDATLAAYDNFDDRYLGTKSSAPTLDNDGDALVAGALYFDSTSGAMQVYTGSAWVAAYVSGTGFLALTGGTMSGDINFGDNDKAIFGAGNDLQIYHDGTGNNSYILDAGAGDLYIAGENNVRITSNTGLEAMATFTANGAATLYYDNAPKIATTSTGVDVTGTVTADGLTVDGNVGVGTSSPNSHLTTQTTSTSTSAFDFGVQINNSFASNDSICALGFHNRADVNGTGIGGAIAYVGGGVSGGSGNITFNIKDNTDISNVVDVADEKMRITSSGALLVATTTAGGDGYTLESNGFLTHARASGGAQSMVGYKNGGNFVGEIRTSTIATAYITSSDYRLKENVTYDWDATTRLKQLKPARFNFIIEPDITVDGFIAHEAQEVVPESVSGTHNDVDDDGNPVYQGIDQAKLVPLLVKTIQELEARITALEAD